MRYCIAIDGGGSKTDIVLFDETGRIFRRYVGPGGNATDIGTEAVARMDANLAKVVPAAPGPIAALYGGVAGVLPNGDVYSAELSKKYSFGALHFEDDGCNLISGALGHADGCGMVCGTGSSLFARVEGQPLRHIGGKGYLIDTGGSGFELGRDAVCMALRAVDGRCKKTILTDLLADMIGQPVDDKIIPKVHHGGRPYIATFASAVFEGRKRGDWACEEIFEHGSSLMADLTLAAEQYFEDGFTVVMGGGIVAHYPEYAEAIREKSSPKATVVLQKVPPVYGAAVEAMWDAGIDVTELFRTRFLSDYVKTEKQPQLFAV